MNCDICNSHTHLYDVVDFNKSCEEARSKFAPLSGVPVYYNRCDNCGFVFAPMFKSWSSAMFSEKIYNSDYIIFDPDYVQERPTDNAKFLFSNFPSNLIHLDYGGGNGLMSTILKNLGWDSSYYDPFGSSNLDKSKKFNFITSFEVFEHSSNINETLHDILYYLDSRSGILLFSTLISDQQLVKNKRITWWYASPRNGHISLFSELSLSLLAQKFNVHYKKLNNVLHIFYKEIPTWFRV